MSRFRRYLVVVVGAVVLVVLSVPSLWRTVQGALQPVVLPVTRIGAALGNLARALFSLSEIQIENEKLRQELAAARAREAELNQLGYENNRLRELAGVPVPAGTRGLGVEVIGEQVDEAGSRLLVNRGTRDGVFPGQPVVAGYSSGENGRPRAVLVGTVVNASEQVSSMVLVTSPVSRVLAEVVGPLRSQGLVTGEYNLAMRLNFVPVDEVIPVGSQVVTSGRDPLVPAGLLIGQVTSTGQDSTGFFAHATLAPVVPLDRFRFLTVLQPAER